MHTYIIIYNFSVLYICIISMQILILKDEIKKSTENKCYQFLDEVKYKFFVVF
jgi:hypothetical protein